VRTADRFIPSITLPTFALLQSTACRDSSVGPEEMSYVRITVNVGGVDKANHRTESSYVFQRSPLVTYYLF
jgi:hypothetical protein